jgi:hypothetical protein
MATKKPLQPQPPRSPYDDVGINVKIPADVHKSLRLLCVQNGWTMGEAVTEALIRYLP